MNKIFLIATREFKNRVQKKSFLLATILIPLIFPAIMGILIYVSIQQEKNTSKQVIHYVDKSDFFVPDTSKYVFKEFNGSIEEAKKAFQHDDSFGLLYIPQVEIFNPQGITLWTKRNISPSDKDNITGLIKNQIKEQKMHTLNINQSVLDSLNKDVSINTVTLSETGQEESSNSKLLFGVGMVFGILMYMFIFIYGAQIMQGIIEEKTSKVVEVIVSSVKPFQLMMGKILGLATVGILQFTIWIALISVLSTVVLGYFGIHTPQQDAMAQYGGSDSPGQNEMLTQIMQMPFGYLIFNFLFYFLGGYLIYGALFAAVGSSVDSPAEAQQFMFPVTIPMFISYLSLFTFILKDPNSSISVWLSLIPFTSPIAMMGRVAFMPPIWQLVLSMVLLIAGFIFTTWVAARIYRVGILMHGTKVNYKVLAKWFMMKN